MAIGPIGAINYANQAMPAQTKIQSNFQNRLDIQSSVAASIQEADKKEIEDIRPSEESYKIDPENEHEKKRREAEQKNTQKKPRKKQKEKENREKDEEIITQEHIDIKA